MVVDDESATHREKADDPVKDGGGGEGEGQMKRQQERPRGRKRVKKIKRKQGDDRLTMKEGLPSYRDRRVQLMRWKPTRQLIELELHLCARYI